MLASAPPPQPSLEMNALSRGGSSSLQYTTGSVPLLLHPNPSHFFIPWSEFSSFTSLYNKAYFQTFILVCWSKTPNVVGQN